MFTFSVYERENTHMLIVGYWGFASIITVYVIGTKSTDNISMLLKKAIMAVCVCVCAVGVRGSLMFSLRLNIHYSNQKQDFSVYRHY